MTVVAAATCPLIAAPAVIDVAAGVRLVVVAHPAAVAVKTVVAEAAAVAAAAVAAAATAAPGGVG